MPLRGPGLLLLLLLHSLRAETQEMEVGVTVGSDCLLSCVYPKRLQFNLDEVYVYWQIRESTVVMVHIPQKNSTSEVDGRYRDRAHLFPQNMEQGNFSLLLRNVTPQDTQRFTCLVFRREQGNMKAILKATVTLRVAANFSVPVVNSSSTRQDQELTFMCTSTNGYPRPNVYWVNKTDDTVLDRALHNDTVSLNERGLYDVVSVLRVPWAPGVSVGCCIENVLLRQNLTGSGPEARSPSGNMDRITEDPGHPRGEGDMALNIILPVVLLGAALVGLLCIIRGCRSRTGAQAVVPEQELTAHCPGWGQGVCEQLPRGHQRQLGDGLARACGRRELRAAGPA
ncbi:ICOS ligand isoform X2 [Cavia porcellus]|uniref:ICOS ligand isoform X2 n=1 Tax=Cavia porcellus TaxID=10141 RepID=UPI000661F7EC|nr:ICOS ligand isoform X2 [Cavia porcellus]